MMKESQHSSNDSDNVQEDLSKIHKGRRLLNPTDRAAEILFGLIMTLTFTSTIGIAKTGHAEIKELLIAALSCNLAWGLVDAIMHLIGVLAEESRIKTIIDFVRSTTKTEKAKQFIADSLPPVIASVTTDEELEKIRNKLVGLPDSVSTVQLTSHDFKNAIAIFLLVFVSTFPVVIPFLFIKDTQVALRVSNLVAIALMFLCGWSVAKYVGSNKWAMSISLTLIGIILVLITVVLGG